MASPPLENNDYSVVSWLSFDSSMHGNTLMDSAEFVVETVQGSRLTALVNDTRGNMNTRRIPNNYGLTGPSNADLARSVAKTLPIRSMFAIGVAAAAADEGGGGEEAGPVIGWEG